VALLALGIGAYHELGEPSVRSADVTTQLRANPTERMPEPAPAPPTAVPKIVEKPPSLPPLPTARAVAPPPPASPKPPANRPQLPPDGTKVKQKPRANPPPSKNNPSWLN
jgi:hypothetical protein